MFLSLPPAFSLEKMESLNTNGTSTATGTSSSSKNTNKVDKASRLGVGNNSTKPAQGRENKGSFARPSGSDAGSAAKMRPFAAVLEGVTAGSAAHCGWEEGGVQDGEGEGDALASLVLMLAARKTGKGVVRKEEARGSVRESMGSGK